MVENKVTIITGGASGLDLQISKEFLKNGAKVVLSDINQEKLDEIVADLQSEDFDCIGVKADVTQENDIKELVETTKGKYGRIDVLFNNVGLQHVSKIEEFPTEKLRQMIDIMLVAPFIGTKHVMPIMKEQGSGTILNMASINGVIGFAGKAAYNSAKHGIVGLTKVAALEAAEHSITVNAICPGYVDTPLVRGQMEDLAKERNVAVDKVLDEVLFPLIPQKRLIEIKEIADYAMFLTGNSAKGVTGQAILDEGSPGNNLVYSYI